MMMQNQSHPQKLGVFLLYKGLAHIVHFNCFNQIGQTDKDRKEGRMSAIIETKGLTKVYTPKTALKAVDGLDLSINKGEIFGFLGPNGAGKTTTIRLILDHIRPTSGSVSVFGMNSQTDSVEIHKRIGFLPAELSLWKSYTAKQVVNFLASTRENAPATVKEASKLAERLGLDLGKRVRDFSTGNKRKLGLVIALMHKPELLILDEPTNGLDPLMQQAFNQIMLEIKAEGRTVFLSSHILSEVQAICERVAIIRDGQLKAVERVEKLMHVGFRKVSLTLKDSVSSAWIERVRQTEGVSNMVVDTNRLELRKTGEFGALLQVLAEAPIQDLLVTEPTLEEIFLTFYGNDKSNRKDN